MEVGITCIYIGNRGGHYMYLHWLWRWALHVFTLAMEVGIICIYTGYGGGHYMYLDWLRRLTLFGLAMENDIKSGARPERVEKVVRRCIVMWALSSAMKSSMHNSVHPPEPEINPSKAACGCPCGRVT